MKKLIGIVVIAACVWGFLPLFVELWNLFVWSMQTSLFWLLLHNLLLASIVYLLARGNKVNEILAAEMLRQFKAMNRTLNGVYQALRPDTMAESVEFYRLKNGVTEKVDNMFMKVEGVADLAVAFKDKKGNLAKVDGKPNWAMTPETLGTLVVAEDGMSAVFTAASDLASGSIQVKADADLGEGVKEIIGELAVELSALDAELVEITATIRP